VSECSFLEQPGGIPWGDPLGVSPGVCRQGGSLGEIVSFRPCLSASEAALVNEAMWRIQVLLLLFMRSVLSFLHVPFSFFVFGDSSNRTPGFR
jgi:hypothetical protein